MATLQQQPKKVSLDFSTSTGGNCLFSALLNETDTLDVQYGMLWIKDSGKYSGQKGFDTAFSFHLWNINEETETIYDNFDNIARGLEYCQFDAKHPSQWKVKLVDGSNFRKNGDCNDIANHYRKTFDNIYKAYDAVYVYNFAFESHSFIPGLYTKQLTWDDIDSKIAEAENIIKNNS